MSPELEKEIKAVIKLALEETFVGEDVYEYSDINSDSMFEMLWEYFKDDD